MKNLVHKGLNILLVTICTCIRCSSKNRLRFPSYCQLMMLVRVLTKMERIEGKSFYKEVAKHKIIPQNSLTNTHPFLDVFNRITRFLVCAEFELLQNMAREFYDQTCSLLVFDSSNFTRWRPCSKVCWSYFKLQQQEE